ncbi:uncharacterized protein B0H64DRAFT_376441 [Chaetomium fimeti]|uniref:Uncharacterized protein n=1 Tax=Chaetomium fimeti TaxID=1854472 RepID=A0AAE0HBJ9_9PEZI|nr:hypothetical protein B0H64DRAFT_376441 [Chaetomium fimeti]
MASSSNGAPPSDGTSSSGAPVFTPPSSDHSYASAAGSNDSATSNQYREPSYQLAYYVAQPAGEDGSLYGRLVANQPQAVDLASSRIAFYTARAQQTADQLGQQLR